MIEVRRRIRNELVYTCRHCPVTFVGPEAVHDHADHSWIHYDEVWTCPQCDQDVSLQTAEGEGLAKWEAEMLHECAEDA